MEAALRDLIAEHDLAAISVSDVAKRAGLNRSTFYEHYADVHDLASSACTAVFDELIATARPVETTAVDGPLAVERLLRLFSHVREHAPLYRALLGDDGSARVVNHLLQRLAIAVRPNLAPPETIGPSTRTAATFTAGAVLGLIMDWLARDCAETPDELARACGPLVVAAVVAGRDTA
jgi:AcrR family transcriptional regulator